MGALAETCSAEGDWCTSQFFLPDMVEEPSTASKADVRSALPYVRSGPIADISAKHSHKFSSERGDKPPLRAQPYSSHKCERSPSQGWPVIGHVNGDSL